MDITYHYPPELFQLMLDALPRLCRGKQDLIDFFRGAGLEKPLWVDLERQVVADRDSIKKNEITRKILQRLNQGGEGLLRERRELLRRVVQFEDFSTPWPSDRLIAVGLVAQIAKVVNAKDTVTRIAHERDAERQEKVDLRRAQQEQRDRHRAKLEAVRRDIGHFLTSTNPQKTGVLAETAFNRLFDAYGILVKESFHRRSDENGKSLEQIDGVIELDGTIYLVEVKWTKEPIGVPEVSQHLVRLHLRDGCRGICVSLSGYTDPGIQICKDSLSSRVLVLCLVQELTMLLEAEQDLREFLRKKIQAAIIEKQPFLQLSA